MPIKEQNKNKYPRNWKELRAKVLERAGNKCEQCGVENYAIGYRDNGKFIALENSFADEVYVEEENLKVIKIVLTIAHTCHDESCDNMEHLLALCQQCHIRMDIKHHQRNSFITRHNKKAIADFFNLPTYSFPSLEGNGRGG